jgi:hypothetical protein
MNPEPLVFPPSVRLMRPDEVPNHDDRNSILAEVAKAHATTFTTGYVLSETGRAEFPAYAEINVHAPALWALVSHLGEALLPERAALMIGMKDGPLRHCPYRWKTALLQALIPFGEPLSRDGFVQFGLIWQRSGVTDEIFVEPAKYLKVWTTRRAELERVLQAHGLPRVESLAFVDEYPRITEMTYHPPDMYEHEELIKRVLAVDSELPEA